MLGILSALAAAYLLGSFSPGYFFGRLVRGIDLRNFGNGNTGAKNVYKLVGPFFGYATAVLDILKGVLALLLSVRLISSPDMALLASLAAIIGHNYPFYLGWRGGRGTSVSFGIISASLFYNRSLIGAIVTLFLLFRAVSISTRIQVVKPERKIFRLWGLIFPAFYWFLGRGPALLTVFVSALIFFVFDIFRLSSLKFNTVLFEKLSFILKPKERKFLSTITLFLISACAVIYYFPLKIAATSITFFLVGDMAAEIAGGSFARHFIGRKSLEGGLANFASCLLAGVYLFEPLRLELSFIVIGALAASLTELFSQKIDDNLTVPFCTALILSFATHGASSSLAALF